MYNNKYVLRAGWRYFIVLGGRDGGVVADLQTRNPIVLQLVTRTTFTHIRIIRILAYLWAKAIDFTANIFCEYKRIWMNNTAQMKQHNFVFIANATFLELLTVIVENEFTIRFGIVAAKLQWIIEWNAINEALELTGFLRLTNIHSDFAGFTAVLVEIMAGIIVRTVTVLIILGCHHALLALLGAQFGRTADFRCEKTRAEECNIHARWPCETRTFLFGLGQILATRTTLYQ